MTVLALIRAKNAEPPLGDVDESEPAAAQEAEPHALSYLAHFGLTDAPFGLTPDSDFFFASPPHQEALNTLLYALENGEGFIKITGAVGTGKTLLCRTLLARLPADFQAVYLPNPALDPVGILFSVADELGFKLSGSEGVFRVHKAIQLRLLDLARRNIHVVMIIDEAQAVSLESLESIRLLSNLETEKRKLLTIVMLGQPELDNRLEAIPQLKTRISFHDRLRPLNRDELAAYLQHRLKRAGLAPGAASLFNAGALRHLYKACGGVPRVANVIAHKALMLAYGKGLNGVGAHEVRRAARDTLSANRTGRLGRVVWFAIVISAVGIAAAWFVFRT